MKTSGWEEAGTHASTTPTVNTNDDCPVVGSYGESTTATAEETQQGRTTGKVVVRNCPSSEFTNYEAADEQAKRQQDTKQELNLDEKVRTEG